jgi:hypothetical protein
MGDRPTSTNHRVDNVECASTCSPYLSAQAIFEGELAAIKVGRRGTKSNPLEAWRVRLTRSTLHAATIATLPTHRSCRPNH